MAVDLLQRGREAAQQRVERLRIRDEGDLGERPQGGGVAVLLAPEGGDLPDPTLGARAGGLAVLLHQHADERGLVDVDPSGLQGGRGPVATRGGLAADRGREHGSQRQGKESKAHGRGLLAPFAPSRLACGTSWCPRWLP